MKIALIINSLTQVAGSEQVLLTLYRGFKQAGHDPLFFIVTDYSSELIQTLNLNAIHLKLSYAAKFSRKFKEYFFKQAFAQYENKHGKFDLILSNSLFEKHIVADFEKRFFSIIHIDDYHTAQYENKFKKIQLRLQKRYNDKNLITVSEGIKLNLLKYFQVSPHAIATIYNPIDIENIRLLSANAEPNIPSEPYILHVARFDQQKRHDMLFEAYKRLTVHPKPRLLLLTTPCEALTHLIKQYDLGEAVIVHPFTQNPYPFYKHALLSVLSSQREGFGMVIAESLACGTPVVSTDCFSGPAEILTGRLAQWLSPVNNPALLADNIEKCLKERPIVGPEDVRQFDVKQIVLKYLSL